MNPTIRRAIIIAVFALVLVTMWYIIYLVFFRPGGITPVNNGPGFINGVPVPGNRNVNGPVSNENVNALPLVNGIGGSEGPSSVANGGPTLSDAIVTTRSQELSFATATSTLRFYDQTTGKFFELSEDGTAKTLLSDAVYREVNNIQWSPDGTKAILGFPDQSKILYDFTTKKQTTLPRELNDFSFSPRSDQIVSKYLNGNNRDDQWLMVSRPDGSNAQAAEHLGENAGDVIPAWSPNNQIIATYQKSIDSERTEVIFLGANGENFPSANIEGRGFTPVWSPDGRRILFSSYSPNTNDNPHLYMMSGSPDSLGSGLIDLGLTTRADKCTFSQTGLSIYCAVPYYLNPGSGPQPELSANVPDNIYRIDLLNNTSELIARPVDGTGNQRFSAINLGLSTTEDYLFFVDALTGAIQKIRLR